MPTIILDHINNIEVDPSNCPIPNCHAIDYLPHGIHLLAQSVRQEEVNIIIGSGGNPPTFLLTFHNYQLIACFFNWFSISVVNYARLVALIDLMQKEKFTTKDIENKENHKMVKDYCRNYVKEVMPDIYTWRNKLAAHFAITDPFKNDNLGTLEMSVSIPVNYMKPYYSTASFTPAWSVGTDIPCWKLTKTYEELSDRFWRGSKIQPFPEYS